MMREKNVTRLAGFWATLLLLTISVSYGQPVDESGDAGDVPDSAQDASGISITSIAGHIPAASYWDKFNRDVDMYKITINDPAAFSATTFDTATNFNTYLFLCDSGGKAVYMHDDVPRPGYITPYLQSRLPAGHALGPTMAGDYYLAVTGYICLPYDEDGNLVFETGLGRTVVHGPSASIKPVVHWQSPVYAAFGSGDYQIDLTGVGPIGPLLVEVAIDIYPNRTPNRVFLSRNYTLYVAVQGSADFDVTTLDASTVLFGWSGEEAGPVRAPLIRDLNSDGFIDAMYGFPTFDCGFQLGDTEGWLTGFMADGTLVEGSDSVLVAP